MGKLIEFLAVPMPRRVSYGERAIPDGSKICEHLRLLFKDKTVECRSCGREWKDMGTGQ